jgi:3-(3-hydroxy-phenyl)propionate hydroxylase
MYGCGMSPGNDVTGYELPAFPFVRPPELSGAGAGEYPVVVVGAGLVGLTVAAELGLRGVPVVVLDQKDSPGAAGMASRGIAYARRTLEIFDRIGIAERVRAKGETWSEGRIYDGAREIHLFQIHPDRDQRWPAFVNVQQFHVEAYLVERAREIDGVDVRWHSRVQGAEQDGERVRLNVGTPDGEYRLEARWVVAADGARSSLRRMLGIEAPLVQLEDTWAIVDVRADLPGLQRRLWLNVPALDGGAAIMHCMADGVVRADWQIGQLPDPDAEIEPERVGERLAALLGPGVDFELVSISRWGYRVRVLERMLHGRVAFAGDAAHEIPPFGARGGNSGIQDAENLAWKLEAVLAERAHAALLETYAVERGQAARENALLSTRAQAFITPSSVAGRVLRDAVLALAREHAFARAMLNTGRPSAPTEYADSPLSVPDDGAFDAGPRPGAAAPDAPFAGGHLFSRRREGFLALHFGADPVPARETVGGFALDHVSVGPGERTLHERYGASDGATYVLRPDVHVAGRTRSGDAASIVERALAQVRR